MNAGKIVELFRIKADDTTQPYLWSDTEVLDYLNEAEEEAARRARLLIDSTTTAVCQIAVTIGNASYALDDRVIFIRRAYFVDSALNERRLDPASTVDLDYDRRTRWSEESGTVEKFIQDMDTSKVRLYRKPDVAGTLHMTVVRLPLAEMNDMQDSPEINRRFHRSLVDWMLYRAYSRDDEDTKDEQKAAAALARFTEEFGEKSDAQDEVWLARTHTDELDGQY